MDADAKNSNRSARMDIETVLLESADAPAYLRTANKANHLHALGMSSRAIGRALKASEAISR